MERRAEPRGETQGDETAEFLSAEEAAEVLGVKVSTLYAYVSRGLLASYRQGIRRRRLYRRSEVALLATIAPARGARERPPRADEWIPLTG